jgi:hypothetical protein
MLIARPCLTEGLTKDGAGLDVVDILHAVADTGVPVKVVNVEGTFPLIDQLGNESEEVVVRAQYKGKVVRAINFDNFLTDDVYDVAAGVLIHPAFQ